MNRLLYRVVIVLLSLSVGGAAAQVQNVSYNTLSPNDGLSHISVNSLYQDGDDAMWIATRDGLNKYDGERVRIYRKEHYSPNSLASNNVRKVEGDGGDYLYFATNDSVWELNIDREEFSLIYNGYVNAIHFRERLYIAIDTRIYLWEASSGRLRYYDELGVSGASITALRLDSQGRMWIATAADGIYCREVDGEQRLVVETGAVISIFEDRDGGVWCGTESDGLYYFNSTGELAHHFHSSQGDITTNYIRDIKQDAAGDIWLATNQGVFRYIVAEERMERYSTDGNNASVWAIYVDRQGNIWFGSYFGGVSWFNPDYTILSRYDMYDSYREGLESAVIGRMVEDRDGVLWIATEGSGLFTFDRASGEFRQMLNITNSGEFVGNIKSLCYDERGDRLWIGTHQHGLYRYDMPRGDLRHYLRGDRLDEGVLPSNTIRDIEIYGDRLILATHNGVALFDPATGLSERLFAETSLGYRVPPIINVLVDGEGLLWICVEGGGLYTYNFEREELAHYTSRRGDEKGLSDNNVSTVMEDERGDVWVGYESRGMSRYNRASDDFDHFDSQHSGLAGNRVYEICDNGDGTLSVLTGDGISIFDCESLQSYNYSDSMGYTIHSPNENALYRTRDGVLFIGGVDGLMSIDLDKLANIGRGDFRLKFTTLYVNQDRVTPNDESGILDCTLTHTSAIDLSGNTTSFSVNFTSTNYIFEIEEAVEYMLEGFDRDWLVARGNQISYTNIPPGDYTLALRSAVVGSEVESASLDIHIRPLWFKSSWAWLTYFIFTLATLYYLLHLYRQRIALSEQVRYEQNRVADIESQNRSKLQFFTNISHEFRTPLAVIIGQIELLLRSKQLSGVSRRKMQNIYRSSNELNQLIGELLDFRKHEQGRLTLNISESNISQMMSDLYDIYCEHIASKGVYFHLYKPEEDVMLNCDVLKLRKVVTNLLSNAIKYTKDGDSIILRLEQRADSVVIRVEDTGVGIPANDLQFIFDRFYQGENSAQSSMGGTGIGLSYAKSIVDLHEGAISVDSDLGRGAWFVVSIPRTLDMNEEEEMAEIVEVSEEVESVEEAEVLNPSLVISNSRYKATMLVVEDDEQLLGMLREIFAEQYSVITAVNGREGVEAARRHLPQIIVSDVMMPEMSGVELCQALKSDIATSHIPIVLLTARGAMEQELEGIKCGADDYIIKPFNVQLLLARCNNLVNNRVLLQEKFSKQPEENTYKMATSALDQDILERALAIIDKHIDNVDFDIATFADEIAMSRTNLFNKIKAITSLTPNDFILTVRLKRSATLLRSNPDMSIIEISERVGFNSHRYFSKRFKERFGTTPVAYRKSNTEGE